jgi:hypothetical protein
MKKHYMTPHRGHRSQVSVPKNINRDRLAKSRWDKKEYKKSIKKEEMFRMLDIKNIPEPLQFDNEVEELLESLVEKHKPLFCEPSDSVMNALISLAKTRGIRIVVVRR